MLTATHVLRSLGPIDVRSVQRDAILKWLVLYVAVLAMLARWGLPPLAVLIEGRFAFDLTAYYALVMSFLVLAVPALTGFVVGFLLLDQRDDRTLTALRVTPLTLNGYLIYRTTVPTLVSAVLIVLFVPFAGVVPLNVGEVLLVALVAAPQAPLFALFLAAFASNKVQGFALGKAMGVVMWPPIFAYFAPAEWQWAFGLVPTYWPAKLFWMLDAGDGGVWLVAVIGLVYQALVLAILVRRFNTVVAR